MSTVRTSTITQQDMAQIVAMARQIIADEAKATPAKPRKAAPRKTASKKALGYNC